MGSLRTYCARIALHVFFFARATGCIIFRVISVDCAQSRFFISTLHIMRIHSTTLDLPPLITVKINDKLLCPTSNPRLSLPPLSPKKHSAITWTRHLRLSLFSTKNVRLAFSSVRRCSNNTIHNTITFHRGEKRRTLANYRNILVIASVLVDQTVLARKNI